MRVLIFELTVPPPSLRRVPGATLRGRNLRQIEHPPPNVDVLARVLEGLRRW